MRVEKAYFASTTKGHRHRSSRVQLNLPFPTGKYDNNLSIKNVQQQALRLDLFSDEFIRLGHNAQNTLNKPLGLVFQGFRWRALACFERPTLRGCQFSCAPRQR